MYGGNINKGACRRASKHGVETELANRAKGRTEVGKGLGGVNGRTRRRGHDHSGRKAGHQLDATKVSVIDAYLGCPNSAN